MNQNDLEKLVLKNIKKYTLNANNVYLKKEVMKELNINDITFNKIKYIHNININNVYKISQILNVPINNFFEGNVNYTYLKNYSDILSYSDDLEFKEILNYLDNKYITTKLIYKKSLSEQFMFNLDKYITYIKSLVHIDPIKLKYIINNTIYNNCNKILYSNICYYDNIDYYIKGFNRMFMYKYIKNYKLLSKYIKIKKYNFNELVELLNNNKRAYLYFENISKQNILYYLNIINSVNL